MQGPEAVAALALGYALQWAKGFKKVPSWASQLICALLCIACYWLLVSAPSAANWRDWLVDAVKWALVSIGSASVMGHVGAAPKTDSI